VGVGRFRRLCKRCPNRPEVGIACCEDGKRHSECVTFGTGRRENGLDS
jgi:hypothetical protein